MRTGFKKTGFVLIELIIATAILAAVIPLSKFFIDTIKFAREAKIQQTANHLAQLYMEEYKVIDLKEIDEREETKTVDKRKYVISIEKDPFLIKKERKNFIGKIHVYPKSDSEMGLKFINDTVIEPLLLKGDKCLLEISDTLLKLSQETCDLTLSPEGEPVLDLFVENNPDLTLNIKYTGTRKLLINRVDLGNNPDFKLVVKHGKVGVFENEELMDYQRGAHLLVIVKNNLNEELTRISQTRFIEWAESRE